MFRYRTNNKKGQHEQASPTLFTVKMIRVGPTLMLYAANDEETKNTNISKNSLSHITLVVRDKIVDQSQDAWNKMVRSSVWDPKELFVDLPSLMKDFDNSLLRPLLGSWMTDTNYNDTSSMIVVFIICSNFQYCSASSTLNHSSGLNPLPPVALHMELWRMIPRGREKRKKIKRARKSLTNIGALAELKDKIL